MNSDSFLHQVQLSRIPIRENLSEVSPSVRFFFLQIIQFCYVWRLILQWNRLIELLAYIFSMVYVVDDLQLDDTSFSISEGSRQVNNNNNNNNNKVFEDKDIYLLVQV